MKKILIILLLFVSVKCFSQAQIVTGSSSYCQILKSITSKIRSSDSVLVTGTFLTNGSVSGVTWSQSSGSAVTLPSPTLNWSTGVVAQSSFWLSGLTPGNYSFTAIATINGVSFQTIDSLVVVANPVCPPIPLANARILSWSVIPASASVPGRIQVLFWDQLTALLP